VLCGRGVVEQHVTTIVPADAVRHGAAALLQAYVAGQWVPEQAERELAEDLAMGQWSGPYFRACLREVPAAVRSGRLIDVLAPAVEVLDQADVDEDVVRQLRVLIDAITPDL
jgi:hypothetical protein